MSLKKITKQCEICGRNVTAEEFLFTGKVSGMCGMLHNTWTEHQKIQRQKCYDDIPMEKKKLFLDTFKTGKTIGESYKIAGLTQEEGFAVMDLNIKSALYLSDEPV